EEGRHLILGSITSRIRPACIAGRYRASTEARMDPAYCPCVVFNCQMPVVLGKKTGPYQGASDFGFLRLRNTLRIPFGAEGAMSCGDHSPLPHTSGGTWAQGRPNDAESSSETKYSPSSGA